MIEPISFLSNVGGSITATVTFSNLVLGLKNCPEEAKTCLNLVKLVNADIEFAVSLRTKHRVILAQRPDDAKRIDDILHSAQLSLKSVGSLVEKLNPSAYDGKIPFKQRLRWFLGDSASFELRTRDLQVQHVAVQGEISWLRMIELVAPLHSVAETKTSFDSFDLWKRDRGDDDQDACNADSYRTETNQHFLSPNPSVTSFLHRSHSTQTLVESVSDVNQLQHHDDINHWVQNSWDSSLDYSGKNFYAELPGSSDFGMQSVPKGPTITTREVQDDEEVSSFFRAWREDQAERREENDALG